MILIRKILFLLPFSELSFIWIFFDIDVVSQGDNFGGSFNYCHPDAGTQSGNIIWWPKEMSMFRSHLHNEYKSSVSFSKNKFYLFVEFINNLFK